MGADMDVSCAAPGVCGGQWFYCFYNYNIITIIVFLVKMWVVLFLWTMLLMLSLDWS